LEKTKGQNLIQGASILAASTMIVKLIGAVFKIPLGNILNGDAMGYFSTAYSVFTMVYAISTAGLPAATAKIVAEQAAKDRYRDIQKIRKLSLRLFLILGIIGTALLILFSGVYVRTAENEDALYSVIAIAPAIFFGCVTSAYRGYFEGMRNMKPTAMSQIVEVVAKLIFGLVLSLAVVTVGNNQFEETGIVFGKAAASAEAAGIIIAPYASAAAILGVTISTFVGTVYLIIRYRMKGDAVTEEDLKYSPKAISSKTLLVRLIKIAIPISLGSIVMNVAQLIDTLTIIGRLDVAFENFPDKMAEIFGNVISSEFLTEGKGANFIFGSYSGYALSVFNLIPSFTSVFGKSALPNVTTAWISKNMQAVKVNIESVIRMTSLIAIPASFGIFFMAEPILALLYPAKTAEVAIASGVLSWQGISLIFLGLASPLFAVLQGLGRPDLPPKFMVVGAVLKFFFNYVLIAIPAINVNGAAAGTASCYIAIFVLCMVYLQKITNIRFSVAKLLGKTLLAGFLCGASARAIYMLLANLTQSRIITLVSIGMAAVVYAVVLLFSKALSRDDILMLPKGKKVANILEKYGFMR